MATHLRLQTDFSLQTHTVGGVISRMFRVHFALFTVEVSARRNMIHRARRDEQSGSRTSQTHNRALIIRKDKARGSIVKCYGGSALDGSHGSCQAPAHQSLELGWVFRQAAVSRPPNSAMSATVPGPLVQSGGHWTVDSRGARGQQCGLVGE